MHSLSDLPMPLRERIDIQCGLFEQAWIRGEQPDLADYLLTLADIGARLIAHEPLPSTADREPFLVEQTADLTDNKHVLALIVTPVAAPFHGL